MSTNFARYVQGFDTIDYTPVSAVSAGQVFVIGDLIAVAKLDIAAGIQGALHLVGVYDFPKVTTGGSGIAVGTTVYWNSDTSNAQAAASTYKQLGKVVKAAADPGASGAIPVTASGYVDIVTAAAEARTIAAPTSKGQQLLLSMKTDGGDCVVTVASTVNQAGNNTITFNDAGDAVLLVAKTNGANIRWSVAMNDGAVLSTV
jgi:predicted RecA/RadA family phage recombinase